MLKKKSVQKVAFLSKTETVIDNRFFTVCRKRHSHSKFLRILRRWDSTQGVNQIPVLFVMVSYSVSKISVPAPKLTDTYSSIWKNLLPEKGG